MASDVVFRPATLARSWNRRFRTSERGSETSRRQPLLIWLDRFRRRFGNSPMTTVHSEAHGVRLLWQVAQAATQDSADQPLDRDSLVQFFTIHPEGVLLPALALGIRESWECARAQYDPVILPRVCRFARRFTGTWRGSELAEQGLVLAWEQLFLGGVSQLLESVKGFSDWLEKQARRELRRLCRNVRSKGPHSLWSEPSTILEPGEPIADSEEGTLYRKELLPALLKLPERDRVILWWLYAQELPVPVVARRCRLSLKHLRLLASRARKRVRRVVEEFLPPSSTHRSHV